MQNPLMIDEILALARLATLAFEKPLKYMGSSQKTENKAR